MKIIFGLLAMLFLLLGGIFVYQKYMKDSTFLPQKTATVTIKNYVIKLLVAKTDKEREIGLSGKTSIAKDSGMIFVFENADYHPFWMKNMKFPIDIIYINNNRIVTIHSNVPPATDKETAPPVYKPEEPADKVIEITSGLSKKYGFQKGEEVKIENL